MRISVLIGIREDGSSEPIASGVYEDLSKIAKELAIENKTEFFKTQLYTQPLRTWKCAKKAEAPKSKGRGRPKKDEE